MIECQHVLGHLLGGLLDGVYMRKQLIIRGSSKLFAFNIAITSIFYGVWRSPVEVRSTCNAAWTASGDSDNK